MGQQIIEQPNGKYSVFSSVTDTFVCMDATYEELIEFFVESARRNTEVNINRTMKQLINNEKPYYQFTKSWEEAVESHKRHTDSSEPETQRMLKDTGEGVKYTYKKDVSNCIFMHFGLTYCVWPVDDKEKKLCYSPEDMDNSRGKPLNICEDCYKYWLIDNKSQES